MGGKPFVTDPKSKAWYMMALSSHVLLLAAKAPAQSGFVVVVATGPKSNFVSAKSGQVKCTLQQVWPFGNVESFEK